MAADRLPREEIGRLYETVGPRLLQYLERRTGNPALAADLVQDIFVGLLRSPIAAGSPQEAKSWLYRAAHSRLIDSVRRERRSRLLLRFEREPVAAPAAESGFERVFRLLKPRDGALLWLAYVEEMSHEEIAKVLNVKPGSVKVLLYRSRRRLRDAVVKSGLTPEFSL